MKITKAHQAHIFDTITEYLSMVATDRKSTIRQIVETHREYVRKTGRYQNLDKRVAWDIFRRAGLMPWLTENIYSYADDGHVDTVLRHVMAKLM